LSSWSRRIARGVPWDDWIRTVEVEPSLYAADFSQLGYQIDVLLRAGVRIFHFDIGDGHFVPPITIGPIVLESISPLVHAASAVLDCHLMTESPERHFAAIAAAGGDSVTVHYEACEDLDAAVAAARDHELQVGVAFKPATSPVDVAAVADGVDLVLCMSIEPGYSGQAFMPEAIERVRLLRGLVPPEIHVQVDGGVGPENIRALYDAGANLLVAGTSIFDREDLPRAYRRLVQSLA
jgi:ribulose-phosphate 3-epimerase